MNDLIDILKKHFPEFYCNTRWSETEMFSKYYEKVNKIDLVDTMISYFVKKDVKSSQIAKILELMSYIPESTELNDILHLNNIYLSRVPVHSFEYSLAIVNRSKILYKMGKFKECLKDINLFFSTIYPEYLAIDMYIQQTTCYIKLEMPFHAKESWHLSKISFENNKKNYILNENEILETLSWLNKNIYELYQVDDTNSDKKWLLKSEIKNGRNPLLVDASQDVEIKLDEKGVKHVFAKNDIQPGDILFMEKPYVHYTAKTLIPFTICENCLEISFNCIPCHECTQFVYCSEECRLEHWEKFHQWECFGEMRHVLYNDNLQLALHLLFKATEDKFLLMPELDNVFGSRFNRYSFIANLPTNKEKFCQSELNAFLKNALWLILYLRLFTNFIKFFKETIKPVEKTEEEVIQMLGGLLMKYQMIVYNNITSIYVLKTTLNELQNGLILNYISIGKGIYVSSGLVKYSYNSNVIQSYQGNLRIVKAYTNIKAGTEIFLGQVPMATLTNFYPYNGEACSPMQMNPKWKPFVCVKCKGKAFHQCCTTAKCSDCSFAFNCTSNLVLQMQLEQILYESDIDTVESYFPQMQELLHKEHYFYLEYYNYCIMTYTNEENYNTCFDYINLWLKLSEILFPKINMETLSMLMLTMFFNLKKCLHFKNKNTTKYKYYLLETETMIMACVDIYKYFAGIETASKLVKKLIDYINTENLSVLYDFNQYI